MGTFFVGYEQKYFKKVADKKVFRIVTQNKI